MQAPAEECVKAVPLERAVDLGRQCVARDHRVEIVTEDRADCGKVLRWRFLPIRKFVARSMRK
jgi:hypothetical protein